MKNGPTYIHTLHTLSSLSSLGLPLPTDGFLHPLVCPLTKVVNIAKIAKMTKVANPVRSNHLRYGEITPPDTLY